jgi:TrwC relaxase
LKRIEEMLRITTSHSAEAAKNYFDVALKANDHYTKDVGTWGGKGAEILGLKGDVQRKDLVALANNRWLGANGKRLTARMNRTRLEDVIDKTGVPTIDVDETMAAIEARMETKVRKGYRHDNRLSPNMAYAKFVHDDALCSN